ncbi:MAG: hypothetical protein LBR24_02225 [Methanobrevibacter sp.]|jgi:hypothetical protein|nr:hypothetical protein [Methanobrevibacter sp.]
MIKLVQSWTHIENNTKPSEGITFRLIVDFYTNEQYVPFRISGSFIKFTVKSRYKGNELQFVQNKNNQIIINLGNLDEWPDSFYKENLKHIKIEISYIDTNPKFKRRIFPFSLFKTGYDASFAIPIITEGEFSLTLPAGLKLDKRENKKIKMLIEFIKEDKIKLTEVFFHNNYYKICENDKISYNFLLKQNSRKYLLDLFKNQKIKINNLYVCYNVINQKKFWWFPIFPIFLLSIGIINLFIKFLPNFYLAGIMIYISFIILYYTHIKENYEIPWNRTIIINTIISGVLILFPTICLNITALIFL